MATLDVVTLENAKRRLGGSVTRAVDDVSLASDISGLSALFDSTFGAVVVRAVVDEQTCPNRSLAGWVERWPVAASPAPTVDVGTVEIVDRRFGELLFSDSQASTVSYTAGRFATTDDVDEDFVAGFIIALRNWRQAETASPFVPAGPDYPTPRMPFPTFAMPNATMQLLSKYRRHEGVA